jgi:hypothetical protein
MRNIAPVCVYSRRHVGIIVGASLCSMLITLIEAKFLKLRVYTHVGT